METIFEEGTLFRARLGFVSIVGGRTVHPRDIDVLVGGMRMPHVQGVRMKDAEPGRLGTIFYGERHPGPEEVAGDVDIVVHDPDDGSELRRFSVAGCTWTRSGPDWDFCGVPGDPVLAAAAARAGRLRALLEFHQPVMHPVRGNNERVIVTAPIGERAYWLAGPSIQSTVLRATAIEVPVARAGSDQELAGVVRALAHEAGEGYKVHVAVFGTRAIGAVAVRVRP